MAYVDAYVPFDLNAINLNWYDQNLDDAGLEDNTNIDVNGTVYEDMFWVDGYDGWDYLELVFLGSGIAQSLSGVVTAGTVNFVGEIDLFTEELLWYVEGVSVSAVDIYNAALTPSNADEIEIIEEALAGDDTILLSDYADHMYGFDGDDDIFGYDGNDTLEGGAGADWLTGGAGNDTLIGGTGEDEAFYDDAFDGVQVDLTIGVAKSRGADAGIGVDTLSGIEHVTGSFYSDLLTGNSLSNLLDGGSGDDVVSGAGGLDWLLGNDGNDQLLGGAANDELYGESGNDLLDGGTGTDYLDGGEDSDIYLIASSSDHASAEIEDTGLSGIDELRFSATGSAQTLLVRAGDLGIERFVIGTGTGATAVTTGLLAHNVDASALNYGVEIIGNSGANTLKGGSAWDYLSGGNGIDRLYANGGSDVLDGGREADIMYGGAGDDIYIVDHLSDAPIELADGGIDQVNASVAHTLKANVENLTLTGAYSIHGRGNGEDNFITGNSGSNRLWGEGGDDTLTGEAGNDILDGGTGSDTLIGGLGRDVYIVDSATDTVVEFYEGEGSSLYIDRVESTVDYTLSNSLEDLTLLGTGDIDGLGNNYANVLRGNSGSNFLAGFGANDKIYGGASADELDGGAGNDWLEGGAGGDQVTGGLGADRFVFREGDLAGLMLPDTIHDFVRAQGDKIRLDLVDANSVLDGNQAFLFVGTGAFTNVAGQLRFEQSEGNTFVQGDLDGDGDADFIIQVDGTVNFISSDFIL